MDRLLRISAVALVAVFLGVPLIASAAVVSHSYTAKSNLPQGTVVFISGSDVTPTDTSTTSEPDLGVVVPSGSTLVELTTANASVEVARLGTIPTLVSDINGPIKKGDVVTLSPVAGTAMKRLQFGRSLGVAQEDLANVGDLTTQTVNEQGGKTRQIKIGLINVSLANGANGTSYGNIPSWIKSVANGLAGHQVSDARVIAAAVIFVAAIIWTVILIYSGVVGGILATGRNPLSGGWVFMNVLALLMYIGVIMAVTLSLAYSLLRT